MAAVIAHVPESPGLVRNCQDLRVRLNQLGPPARTIGAWTKLALVIYPARQNPKSTTTELLLITSLPLKINRSRFVIHNNSYVVV